MYADDYDAGKLQIGIFTVFSIYFFLFYVNIYNMVFLIIYIFPLYLYVSVLFEKIYYSKIIMQNYQREFTKFIGIIP